MWSIAEPLDFDQDELNVTPIPRPKTVAESDAPVQVHFKLTYPLTDNVPWSARSATFEASTVGQVCHKIKSVYHDLYQEDVKLGGVTADEYREKNPNYRLLNRPHGPWIWGHDIEDLAIEILDFEWKSPTEVVVDVSVGS